jgi:hypothetical protein
MTADDKLMGSLLALDVPTCCQAVTGEHVCVCMSPLLTLPRKRSRISATPVPGVSARMPQRPSWLAARLAIWST